MLQDRPIVFEKPGVHTSTYYLNARLGHLAKFFEIKFIETVYWTIMLIIHCQNRPDILQKCIQPLHWSESSQSCQISAHLQIRDEIRSLRETRRLSSVPFFPSWNKKGKNRRRKEMETGKREGTKMEQTGFGWHIATGWRAVPFLFESCRSIHGSTVPGTRRRENVEQLAGMGHTSFWNQRGGGTKARCSKWKTAKFHEQTCVPCPTYSLVGTWNHAGGARGKRRTCSLSFVLTLGKWKSRTRLELQSQMLDIGFFLR